MKKDQMDDSFDHSLLSQGINDISKTWKSLILIIQILSLIVLVLKRQSELLRFFLIARYDLSLEISSVSPT
jgi:hypothetical protein